MDQEPPTVSVNLSARQFQQPALVAEVQRALSVTGLPPRHLRLEITESAMIEDADEAAATLHRLRGLGVRVAIDDFGTGYSNLGYLRRFPVDQLKIDRTFMAEAVRDADATIVRAIIGLAHALGLSVVAEGVETDEQVALLRGLGCEMGQGYLFGEPMAIGQVPARGRGWGPGGKVSGWLPAPARCDLPTQKRTYG
jgi:EAL domain-containing protein (putative c-di-GMP-specific phosphodiesterase class I)